MSKHTSITRSITDPTQGRSSLARRLRPRSAASISLFCVAVPALSGCGKHQPAPAPVPVVVKVLTLENIAASRRFSGSIEPLQTTSLAFKLSGTVQRLFRPSGLDRDVQVGDELAKGTVIAELDEGDLRRAKAGAEARVAQLEARVSTARETLTIATRNLARFDNSAGSVSKLARDEAEARRVAAAGEVESVEHALADARVQLDQANDDYANRKLIVPFDHATVAEKSIEPGERKAAHEVAFRLIDISTLHVNFGVPDTMIGVPAVDLSPSERLCLGQELPITADAFEGRALKGTVTKIAPEADATTRTFLTQLTLPNPEVGPGGQRLLRPGMIVSVVVGASLDQKAMLLPLTAVHRGRSPDEFVVYEVVYERGGEGGQDVIRARKVSLGGVHDNQVEVLPQESDVRPGSRIVVSTSERLCNGIAARVMPQTTGSAAALSHPEAQ